MKKKISDKIFPLSLLLLFSVVVSSQEKAVITPYIQLQYLKNTDNVRILQTALTYSKDRMELPIPGMEISFYKGAGRKEFIATAITDNKGVAKLELGKDINLAADNAGMWAFSSEFKGSDTIAPGKSEITVRDVNLEMMLSATDSIKTIGLKASVKEGGRDKPVSGEIVKVYVPRMFSLLPLGEVTLDSTGAGSLEFPTDLPGDSTGTVTIIAKFEENQTYGNVEKLSTVKWGKRTDYLYPSTHRALWTKTAPRWMIFTLSILLAGVWGHYLFAIISLIRIKIDAKRLAKKEYRA
jgi:hypothetical protein